MNRHSTLESTATRSLWLVAIAIAGSIAVGCDDDPPDGDADADADADGEDEILAVTILQTSDTHHRASGFGAQSAYTPLEIADADPVLGGYARLAALIDGIRAEQEAAGVPVVVVDSGDFLMGTIYDMTFADPLALRFLNAVGYDVITLGNHEYDWGPDGLAMVLDNALASDPPFAVPIVASNTMLSESDPGDDALAAHFQSGTITNRLVLELDNGLRVGFLGIMGSNAEADAVTSAPVGFEQSAMLLNGVATTLREEDGADLVVALSHSGINDDVASGEDVTFAETLPEIDVFCSGHSHVPTPQAIEVGESIVVQPGEYGEWLSRIDLLYNVTQRRVESFEFELLPVDDSIEGDPEIQSMVDDAHATLDPLLEEALGLGSLDPVVELSFEMRRERMAESGIGNLCADALRATATEAVIGSDDETPFTLAVMPNGMVRDDLHASDDEVVTFSDVFNVLPLGLSPDPANQGMPGWPLVSAYLSGVELRSICEVSASLAEAIGSSSVYLNVAGIRCEYDPSGTSMATVTRVFLCGDTLPEASGGDGDVFSSECETEVDFEDETTLYRGVIDLYTFLAMEQVTIFLPLAPKHADGSTIELADPEDYMATRIDVDLVTPGVQELANWVALLSFLRSLEDGGGDATLPDVPADVYDEGGIGLGRFIAL